MTYRNLMITMLLGGLWHGAAWTFVLWGALHGAGLSPSTRSAAGCARRSWLRWVVTFHLVVLGVDPLPRRRTSRSPATSSRSCRARAPATLWTPAGVAAIVVVIGLQLLPEPPGRARCSCGSSGCGPRRSASASPSSSLLVAATVSAPGRRPVHLLPLLT